MAKKLNKIPEEKMDGVYSTVLKKIKIARSFHNFTVPNVKDFYKVLSFENFLMIGVPPDADPNKPELKLLTVFPCYPLALSFSDLQSTINYAFPTGVVKTKQPTDGEGAIIDEFTFGLRGADEMLYGVCIHFRIPEKTDDLLFVTENNKNFAFCYVLLTHQMDLTAHFRFLTYLVKSVIRWEKVIVDVDLPNDMQPCKISFSGEYEVEAPSGMTRLSNFFRYKKMKINKWFARDISHYMGLQRRDKNYLYYQSNNTQIIIPAVPRVVSNAFTVGCATFDCLFSLLSVDNIIKLYTAIVLEHKVIIVSQKVSRVSNCVLAFRALLHPLKIQACFIPVFPSLPEYQELLQNPTPFIYGMPITANSNIKITDDQICIAFVDKNEVVDKSLDVRIPDADDLKEQLKCILTSYEAEIKVPERFHKRLLQGTMPLNTEPSQAWVDFFKNIDPMMMPPHYMSQLQQNYIFTPRVVNKILNIFRNASFIKFIIEYEEGCRVTETTDPDDPIIVFNKDMFMTITGPKHKEFFEKFLDTQMFETFIQRRIDKTKQQKKFNENPTKENAELLKMFEDEELLFEYI